MNRIERDNLGEMEIPSNVYWGIHTARSLNNFNISHYKTPQRLIKALALIKKAAAQANAELGYLAQTISGAIQQACDEIGSGAFAGEFPLDAMQGGAGTSTNMNINEVIANRALEICGKKKGEYEFIHPIEHINLHQSTNDVYPTALKAAAIFALRELSVEIAGVQGALQQKEKEFADIVSIGRTEMQDAVPITLGAQFSSFADAFARDRWRTFKSEERLRVVNIGGTAVGTGLTAPRDYIFLVIEKLRLLSGLGLMRAEQVMDATANADVFIEASGMLSANAANLKKTALDLRLLHFLREIELPAMQAGSSIMPGKINPVITEAIISTSMKVMNNTALISDCASSGTLQINEYIPLIAFAFLESLDLLININKIFTEHIKSIRANREICEQHFEQNEIIITAFLPQLGYTRCEELLNEYNTSGLKNFRSFLNDKLGEETVMQTLAPHNLMALGYRK